MPSPEPITYKSIKVEVVEPDDQPFVVLVMAKLLLNEGIQLDKDYHHQNPRAIEAAKKCLRVSIALQLYANIRQQGREMRRYLIENSWSIPMDTWQELSAMIHKIETAGSELTEPHAKETKEDQTPANTGSH